MLTVSPTICNFNSTKLAQTSLTTNPDLQNKKIKINKINFNKQEKTLIPIEGKKIINKNSPPN